MIFLKQLKEDFLKLEKGSDDLFTIIQQDIKNVVDKIKTIENKRKIGFGV